MLDLEFAAQALAGLDEAPGRAPGPRQTIPANRRHPCSQYRVALFSSRRAMVNGKRDQLVCFAACVVAGHHGLQLIDIGVSIAVVLGRVAVAVRIRSALIVITRRIGRIRWVPGLQVPLIGACLFPQLNMFVSHRYIGVEVETPGGSQIKQPFLTSEAVCRIAAPISDETRLRAADRGALTRDDPGGPHPTARCALGCVCALAFGFACADAYLDDVVPALPGPVKSGMGRTDV